MEAVTVNAALCTACEGCVEVCPVEAIHIERDRAVVGPECIVCFACAAICPVSAIVEPLSQPGPIWPERPGAGAFCNPRPSEQAAPPFRFRPLAEPRAPSRLGAARGFEADEYPQLGSAALRGRRGLWRR